MARLVPDARPSAVRCTGPRGMLCLAALGSLVTTVGISACQPTVDVEIDSILVVDTLLAISGDLLHAVGSVQTHGGRILVNNVGTRSVLVFNDAGNVSHRIGGFGQGPGELQSLSDVLAAGDSVFVLDALARRITVYDVRDTLTVLHTYALPDAIGAAERIALLGDAGIVIAWRLRRPSLEETGSIAVFRDSVAFGVWEPTSTHVERLLSIPGREYYYGVGDEGTPYIAMPAFGTQSYYAVVDSGVVWADGRTGTIKYSSWSGADTTLMAITPSTLSRSQRTWFDLRVEERARQSSNAAQVRHRANQGLEALGADPSLPVFGGLLVDWPALIARRYEYPDSQATQLWLHYDHQTGRTLRLPIDRPATRVVFVSGDTIIAILSDSLNVQSISLVRVGVPH